MPVDKRLDLRALARTFSDTTNVFLRERVDAFARRIIDLLGENDGDVVPPDPPTGLAAVSGTEQVTLTWDPNTELDLAYYTVYRSLTSGSGMAEIGVYYTETVIDTGLTGGTPYYYEVTATDTADNESDPSEEVPCTPQAAGSGSTPPMPANFTGVDGDGYVDLTWMNVPTILNVVGTNIYRDTSSMPGTRTLIATAVPGEMYTDVGVSNGTTYYYAARSVTGTNDESADSAEYTANPVAVPDTTPPPVPQFNYVTAGDELVGVSIAPVYAPDLAGYRVYYGTAPGGPYVLYRGTTTMLRFSISNLTNATQYYFIVRSIDTTGNESADSVELDATPAPMADITPPDPVTNFMFTNIGETSLTLSWDENMAVDLDRYEIEYSFTPLGSASGPFSALQTILRSANQTTYVHEDLDDEVTYHYRIRPVDTTGNLGDWSNVISGSPTGTGVVVPPPPGGGAINGDTGLSASVGIYRSPGKTYDYVVDASTFTTFAGSGLQAACFAFTNYVAELVATAQQNGNPVPDFTATRWAILMPERSDLSAEGGKKHRVSTDGATHWETVSARFPDEAFSYIDFVAPWPTASIGDSLATAKAAEKKYKVGRVQNGKAAGGSGPGSAGMFEINTNLSNRFRGDINFVGFEFQLADNWGIGTPASGKELFIGFTLCDFLNDYDYNAVVDPDVLEPGWPFTAPDPNNSSQNLQTHPYGPSGSHTQSPTSKSIPRWWISTYSAGLKTLDYCHFEGWWLWEHTIYTRSPWPCDTSIESTTFEACGGQHWQNTCRPNPDAYSSDLDPVDPTNPYPPVNTTVQGPHSYGGGTYNVNVGSERGTMTFRNCWFLNHSRSTWSSACFSEYGTHTVWDMEDCEVIVNHRGPVKTWPPVVANIRDHQAFCPTEDWAYQASKNGSFMVFADGGGPRNVNFMAGQPLQTNRKFIARRVYYHATAIIQDCLRFNHIEEVDVEDCGFWIDELTYPTVTHIKRISVSAGNDDIPGAPPLIACESFRWVNNNTTAARAAFIAKHGVGGTAGTDAVPAYAANSYITPTINVHHWDGVSGSGDHLYDGGHTWGTNAEQDHTATNLTFASENRNLSTASPALPNVATGV